MKKIEFCVVLHCFALFCINFHYFALFCTRLIPGRQLKTTYTQTSVTSLMSIAPTSKPNAKRNGKVSFLAALSAIEADILAGHTLTDVYAKHGKALDIGYSQFTRYVSRYIRGHHYNQKRKTNASTPACLARSDKHRAPVGDGVANASPRPLPGGKNAKRRSTGGPIVTPATTAKKFVFDPTAAHTRKDELF
jgi:hypothetical protein